MTSPELILYSTVKAGSISTKIRNKTRMPTFVIFIQCSIGSTSHSNQTRKRNKRHPNWKGRSKALFANDVILYVENPKDSTKNLLELIHEFTKIERYKINIQKSVAFLYINNELSEREIKKTILFTITSKKNNIPRN